MSYNPISHVAKHILIYFGGIIKIARVEQKITQEDLSERLNVSRGTVQRMQNGDPNVAIGTYIEASVILKIPLMGCKKEQTENISKLLSYMYPLLPKIPSVPPGLDVHEDWEFDENGKAYNVYDDF